MKPVFFENIRTLEQLVCDDLRNYCIIDGEKYLAVRRMQEHRTFLVRENILKPTKRVKEKESSR